MNHFAAHTHGAGSRLHAACACASVRRFSPGSTARKYERSRPFQITHLSLDLEVNLDDESVSGTAALDIVRRAHSGTEIVLDAVGFSLGRVALRADEGKLTELTEKTDYFYDGEHITVRIPEALSRGSLEITYRAAPRLGLYFLRPDAKVPQRPLQVWSQCQDEDGRHFFPCQDKPHVKMTYEMRARVPQGMTVLSGGELIDKSTPSKGPWQYHYRLDAPTPAYLITLVVGKFDEWEESVTLPSGKEIPLRYLVPPGQIEDGKRAFHLTGDAIRLFSERTGVDYAFDRYTQIVVADFIFGGMENTTATTMYEHILLDKTAAIDVEAYDLVAHELAHQWFGDLVTCRDWSHAWLNEGFATYFEHVDREHRLGLDEYEHNVTADLNIYLGEARGDYQRPIVCRDYDEPIDLFDRHLYQKGGLVLHMLRRNLGDDIFWKGVKNYLEKHRGGIVETNDLMRTLEEVSGLSLEKFFDQWVYSPGHPDVSVRVAYADKLLTIDVEQTQKGADVPTFELPFEVEVTIEGKTTLHKRLVAEKKSTIVVRSEVRPDRVSIDPRYLIAAPIELRAPADMLRDLLKNGERARARRMAAGALGKRHDLMSLDALEGALANEDEMWMVRAKAAESLGKLRGEKAEAALVTASTTKDPKVRRAVATALGVLRGEAAEKALVVLTRDKSYLVSAAAARALGHFPSKATTKLLSNLLKKDSWSEVVRAGALSALAQSGDEDALPTLMEWTEYGKPLRARRAAIAALPRLGDGQRVRQHLGKILADKDPHVRSSVLSALGTLDDPKARSDIEEMLVHELDGGVRTRAGEVLAQLGKRGAAGLRQAKQENQRLKREVDDLKLRLSKLEQLVDGAKPTPGKAPSPPGNPSPKSAAPRKKPLEQKGSGKVVAKKASKKTVAKQASKRAQAKKASTKATSGRMTKKR